MEREENIKTLIEFLQPKFWTVCDDITNACAINKHKCEVCSLRGNLCNEYITYLFAKTVLCAGLYLDHPEDAYEFLAEIALNL